MKATVTFNLVDHDEELAYYRALKAFDLCLALVDIRDRLRETNKYGKEPVSSKEFYDILESRQIHLDELI